jgi:hypothetical protein
MYSHEIMQYLKERNFKITPLEFMAIINTSPQIKRVLLEHNDSVYTILTDDGLVVNAEIIEEPQVKKMTLKKDSN